MALLDVSMDDMALDAESGAAAPLSAMGEKVLEASGFLKKLANPDRLLVCCALMEGERSVRELEEQLGIRQPGLSQQLAELRRAELVVPRKDGKQVFYSLADHKVRTVIETLHRLFCAE